LGDSGLACPEAAASSLSTNHNGSPVAAAAALQSFRKFRRDNLDLFFTSVAWHPALIVINPVPPELTVRILPRAICASASIVPYVRL
jgi:hypothetical protein